MPREQTITYLEMTAPDQLVPGRLPPQPMALERLGADAVGLARSVCLRVGEPHFWTTRPAWSLDRWCDHLARPEVQYWLATVDGEPIGMAELELKAGVDVEILLFGLLPEWVGRGFGGHLLTRATELAWSATGPGHERTRRVWLHTSSLDHANALPNYTQRGFRVVRVEDRPGPG